jgi:large subunit ribosomal protein L23
MPTLHDTIVKPVMTEKSSAAFQERGEYTFEVHPRANKHQIRAALEQLFNVTVTDVRTLVVRRKEKIQGRRRGATAIWKKAVVTVQDGDSIPVFEG